MKLFYSFLSLLTIFFSTFYINAQLELTGNYKLRSEFANGYKQPLLVGENPGFFIHQGARLGAKYTHSKFQFHFEMQDIRTWGNSDFFGMDNKGYLSIYQANVSIYFTDFLSLKAGRQSIEYDNERIFSKSAWALQEIRHDAAILQFNKNSWKSDLGIAYNQDAVSPTETFYTKNQYKTFQYLWLHKDWTDLNTSFLFLNNGREEVYVKDSIQRKRTNYSQTLGTHINYNKEKFDLEVFAYYQMGMTQFRDPISAYDLGIAGTVKPFTRFKITLGGEILSGTSQYPTSNKTNYSFNPFYTSRHKFSGFMDYFYSENHIDNVGLMDAYLKFNYKFNKFTFSLANHLFFSEADVFDFSTAQNIAKLDSYLGYELDFSVNYQFADEVSIQIGYSQLIGTNTLRHLKGTNQTQLNNWAYVMLTVSPFKNLKL